VPAWGGTARLTRYLGRNHDLDRIGGGCKVDGCEAWRFGRVQSITALAEWKTAARARARSLAANAPRARAVALHWLVGVGEKSLTEALAEERGALLHRPSRSGRRQVRVFGEAQTGAYRKLIDDGSQRLQAAKRALPFVWLFSMDRELRVLPRSVQRH
jgi:enoyl-CoA hydratase/carnithine racemase